MNQEKKLLTITELAEFTGYKISYLRKLCSQRKIPYYNPTGGRRVFFCLDEIIAWMSGTRNKTVTEILNTKM